MTSSRTVEYLLHFPQNYESPKGFKRFKKIRQFKKIENKKKKELANCRAQQSTQEERIRRRQQQTDILEATTSAEDTFYGPGIDDSV